MLKVGSIEYDNGKSVVNRDFYGDGYIFKDEEAYKLHKDEPCYVPETTDTIYTGNDFLSLCNGQEEMADEMFEEVFWQRPESLKTDWEILGEWNWCKDKEKYSSYDDCHWCEKPGCECWQIS